MRAAFFLLVLVNLVFFVWTQGYFGGQEEGREPQRLQDQYQPEKMAVMRPPPPAPQVCRLVDGILAKHAEKLQQALQGAKLAVSVQAIEEPPSYWVNINSLPTKAAADKKAGELKLFGVTDFHVMQADSGSFVISLGVFIDETRANDLLADLNKKGVRSARIDTQTKPPARVRLEVRGAADDIAKGLTELLAGTAGAVATDCP